MPSPLPSSISATNARQEGTNRIRNKFPRLSSPQSDILVAPKTLKGLAKSTDLDKDNVLSRLNTELQSDDILRAMV